MKRAIAFIFCVVWVWNSSAQEVAKKKIKIDHIQVSMGGELGASPMIMSREDFSKLAPTTNLFPPSSIEDIRMGQMFSWNASSFNIQMGWRPSSQDGQEKSQHRAWRAGLTAYGFQTIMYSTSSESQFRVDTLYQSSNGSVYGYIDSTDRQYANGYYKATTLKLDLSHIWSTGLDNRLNLFAGLGVNAGLNLSPRTEILLNHRQTTSIVDTQGTVISSSSSYDSNFDFQRETFHNKMGWSTAAYIPMGIEFRVGQKREYLKNLHLFSEIRPALNYVHVPETRGYLFPTVQSTLGVKWCW